LTVCDLDLTFRVSNYVDAKFHHKRSQSGENFDRIVTGRRDKHSAIHNRSSHEKWRCVGIQSARLVGGNGNGNGQSGAGRLEINYDGVWGTVCNDDFDNNDAKVACKMLGYGYFYSLFYFVTQPPTGGRVLFSIDFFIYFFVCLFVSLSAKLRENCWTDLHEIFREGVDCGVTAGCPDYIFGQLRETQKLGINCVRLNLVFIKD